MSNAKSDVTVPPQRGAAVITGAASGIGRAVAEAFVSYGSHVVLIDIDTDRLHAFAAELSVATAVAGDITDSATRIAAVRAAQATGRPTKYLVNCAATFLAKGEDATNDDWDTALGTNVKAVALMCTAIVPLMRRSGGGSIVNVSSISAHIAQPSRWTYNTTKGALLALTRCQALDLAPDGIRCNSVSPGTIWTPELDRMTEGDRETWAPIFGSHHMLNRVGEPAEVAEAILFLCGPGASFITGTDLRIDGGYLAMGHDSSGPTIRYSVDSSDERAT